MIKKITLITLAVAAIGFSACQQKQAAETAVTGRPDLDTLSYQKALKYVANYEKHAGMVDSTIDDASARNTTKKVPNTRAIWFSIERMDSLVSRIKREHGDGIRFYLATYDSTYKEAFGGNKPNKRYWGHTTLVMVSTKDSTVKPYHQDYFYRKTANGPSQGVIVGTVPENRGEQCPPPATCSTTGATLVQP
jgi:hypothetical protein